jgi:hypothetical protein
MENLNELIGQVAVARQRLIKTASGLSPAQAQFKSSTETWSITDNVEHLVWAEQGAINGMWRALEGFKNNAPIWKGECIHHGLSIEEVVDRTWQSKEKAPEIARPKWGGPTEFWILSLNNCQPLLESLGNALAGFDLEKIIHPHPISGPINILQRMEFLRFHLDRHREQIENIKSDPGFPK